MLGLMRRSGWVVATVLVALVLTHDLVFLIGYGAAYGDALVRTGHDYGWRTTVFLVLAMGGVLLLAAAARLFRLARDARRSSARRNTAEPSLLAFLRSWLVAAAALAVVVSALLLLLENLEHLRIGATLPGLAVLGSPEYPNAALVISVVSFAVGFVAALYRWRLEVLVARIRALRVPHPGRPATTPRPAQRVERRPGSLIGRCLAGRAPPQRDRRSAVSPLVAAAA